MSSDGELIGCYMLWRHRDHPNHQPTFVRVVSYSNVAGFDYTVALIHNDHTMGVYADELTP